MIEVKSKVQAQEDELGVVHADLAAANDAHEQTKKQLATSIICAEVHCGISLWLSQDVNYVIGTIQR